MKHFFALIACIALLTVAAAPVAAQQNQTNTTATDDLPDGVDLGEDVCAEPETIDERTVLCSKTVVDGDTAELVIRSDGHQRVTLTDGAAFMTGGEIRRETRTLRPDEPNTVRFPITRYRNYAAVSIDTGRTLYAVPLEEPSTLIGGPWSSDDVQLSAISAAASTGLVSVVVVFRTILGRTEQPERVA